ncbi:MAG TPA: transglycosylase SLT domain-containing protein [Oligoflexus sp.]|uniref:lytic transglycosylase domain-containing protein n=1 Tax=Oligoflexus sp. TaxID=1971216 RepID=UPI002D7F22FF|nr:transglycosylase SLT domain-containing protein [Oligoflexus sp.]HET9239567.1 transglycosylase SLT domain-containing protein [Oligoflexus sp.]
MKIRYLPVYLVCCLAAACQTAQDPEKTPDTAVLQGTAQTAESSADASALADDDDASYSRRFCQDDIYSLYIKESYLDQFSYEPSKKDKNARRLKQEANLEAYKKLNQHLPLFFGGMPVEATPRVYAWIQYFTGRGRMEFLQWMVRSESFRPLVVPMLEKEGLPQELFFLAMIESGFSNTAFSRSAASGTWQFMKPTAKHYGLQINYWVDERRDPLKSTIAAARYLKDLHKQLRDWYLAVAAYNAGPGKVMRAMQATQSRDYWTLSKSPYLLPETKNYVPKLLAALIIASHPENYGFDVAQDIRNTTPMTTITLDHPYSLTEIAEKLEIPARALQRWNPEIMRGITPPPRRLQPVAYQLRLPKPLADQFATIQSDLQQLTVQDVQMHRIQKGETLDNIAKRYRISVKDLIQMNPDLQPQRLKPGRTIAVPVPAIMTGML